MQIQTDFRRPRGIHSWQKEQFAHWDRRARELAYKKSFADAKKLKYQQNRVVPTAADPAPSVPAPPAAPIDRPCYDNTEIDIDLDNYKGNDAW